MHSRQLLNKLRYVHIAVRLQKTHRLYVPPQMADIGIFASLDPVALDWACVDAVYASKDEGKAALIERMESRNAFLTLEAAQKHGLGQKEYELVNIDL